MAVPRPGISLEQAIPLASKLFSFQTLNTSVVTELESYEDRNFLLKGRITSDKADKQTNETEYVLKILNPVTSRRIGILNLTSKVLLYLNDRGIQCPIPQPSISGKYIIWCRFPKVGLEKAGTCTSEKGDIMDGTELVSYESNDSPVVNCSNDHYCDDNTVVYAIQLLTFIPGKLLCDVKFNADVMYKFGVAIGNLHKILKEFSQTSDLLDTHLEPSDNQWHTENSPASIIQHCHAIEDDARRTLVQEIAQRFQNEFLPKLKQLDTQLIHGDLNEHNIIVDQNTDEQVKIEGFLDFGHSYISHRVLDVGIAVAYMMIESINHDMSVFDASNQVIRGYQSVFPLSSLEMDVMLEAVKLRISQSLVIGAYSYKYVSPGNEYLLYTAKTGWKALDEIFQKPGQDIVYTWLSC
uniref:Hydroxylysine kinase n=1 Tax=Actinia tenebrosa TaxID=6105 RepID=A0A6P8IZQ8_ACTTE